MDEVTKQAKKIRTWDEMMATVLSCGHTNAQHMYSDAGALTIARTKLCDKADREDDNRND